MNHEHPEGGGHGQRDHDDDQESVAGAQEPGENGVGEGAQHTSSSGSRGPHGDDVAVPEEGHVREEGHFTEARREGHGADPQEDPWERREGHHQEADDVQDHDSP